ncbi:Appendage-associated protein [Dirofilaria immitis]
MVHVTLFQLFKEADINNMADMELRAFEAHLDTMLDQLNEESTELIIERPRYAHAVMVFASGDEPGELLTASRIKTLDPVYVPIEAATNGHLIFHHYSENTNATSTVESSSDGCDDRENFDLINAMKIYGDDDIQKALRKLEESRSILDEPITPYPTNTLLSNSSEFDYADDSSTIRSKTPQATHLSISPGCSRSISERYAPLKEGIVMMFPSQLRKELRVSVSSARKLS